MAKQNETGVPVNVPDSYPYQDGVAVQVPDAPAESTDKANTTKGQKATAKEK
jgi:hypothetical protein